MRRKYTFVHALIHEAERIDLKHQHDMPTYVYCGSEVEFRYFTMGSW